jgi:hypothetical protein
MRQQARHPTDGCPSRAYDPGTTALAITSAARARRLRSQAILA